MKKTARETWKHFELFLSFFPLTFSIFERRGSMPTIIFPSFLIHLSPLSLKHNKDEIGECPANRKKNVQNRKLGCILHNFYRLYRFYSS